MAELGGQNTQIKISGASLVMAAEVTTTADDTVYQITNAVKRVLDRETQPTVLDGGVATAEDYTVNYLNGKITFETNASRVITVSGKYLPVTLAAYAHMAKISESADILDATRFSSTHRSRVAGLKSAAGSFSQFDVADDQFVEALVAGDPVMIEHRPISTEEPNRYWALLESSEVQAAVDGLQDETVSWVSYDAWIKLGG